MSDGQKGHNLNISANRREQHGIIYYVRGMAEVDGKRYDRYAVKTHFIGQGEDYINIIEKYVKPICKDGDILYLGEKVISMCQNNTVSKDQVKVGFWAKFLSRFATRNSYGIGMDEPYKLQLAINMKGLPKILWASIAGGVCRLFGKRGVFYEIAGQDVAGIDGFYLQSSFEIYHDLAVLNPRDPDKVCAEIEHKLGISNVIVDANDLNVEIFGLSPGLAAENRKHLVDIVRDNPAGQGDELTPFIIARPLGDGKAEDYVYFSLK